MTNIRTRYAPSPTGIPQLGNIRTALFNYLFARNQKGKFLLRIEDTDQARKVKGAEEKIQESLKILNLNWDGEVTHQSKRLDIYQKHLNVLEGKGLVYKDEGAWRFKIPKEERKIKWNDSVHSAIEFPQNVIEDFVIIKSDGFPTYHFASVVDDHDMQITHVIRGDEWVSSTPKHLILYEAFGWKPPIFAHLPLILGSDKKKLSKREGAKSVFEFLEDGYLPEALINFLALLGWAPKGNEEIFSLTDLVREFSLDRINKNSPIMNIEKLNWFNSQWLRKLSAKDFTEKINEAFPDMDVKITNKVAPIVKERISTLVDYEKLAKFFYKKPEKNDLISQIPLSQNDLENLAKQLEKINNWSRNNLESEINQFTANHKLERKNVLKSIGISISNSLVTPPLFESLEILGMDETIERLKDAASELK